MSVLSLAPISAGILPQNLALLDCVSSGIKRISQFAVKHFSFLSHICLTGFGVKELGFDYSSSQPSKTSIHHLKKIDSINIKYSLIHGSFYLGSGVFGGIACLQDFRLVDFGNALPVLQGIGSGLFLFANFYSLEQNIKIFMHAHKLSDNKNFSSLATRLKVSSILGIVNNLGYIFSTLASFFPPLQLIALILGLFSIFVGTLKIIFDFFFLNPVLTQSLNAVK